MLTLRFRSHLKAGMQTATIRVGRKPLRVEVARSAEEITHGLKHRTHLSANEGMLFDLSTPQQVMFYMADTPIPLDIGFFTSDGVLQEVRQMAPYDDTIIRSSRSDIRYALETNQGWFAGG